MPINSVFQSGDSQTTQQAKEPHIDADEVAVFRRDNQKVSSLNDANGAAIFDVLSKLPNDFMQDNKD